MSQQLLMMAAAAIAGGSQNLTSLATLNGSNLAANLFVSTGGSGTVTSGVRLLSNGTAQDRNLTSPFAFADIAAGEWHIAEPSTGVGSGYEARLTVNSGSSPSSGTTSSWLALSSDRTWDLARTGGGGTSASGNWTLEIRRSGGSTVMASATFDISVSVTEI